MKNNKRNFTLAETLIALTIIGIIAAITIPVFITNYRKQQYVIRLKEGYSILNNGFRLMMASEGVSDIEDTELMQLVNAKGADTDVVAAEKEAAAVLSKYFTKLQLVSRADLKTKSTCADLVGKGPRFWNLGNKSTCSGNYNMNYILPNGMTLSIFIKGTCTTSSYSESEIKAAGGKTYKYCGMIDLDINGEAHPNTWGRDGYRFMLTQAGAVVPYYGLEHAIYNGYFNASTRYTRIINYCNPSESTSNGQGCAARIMEIDNWKMDY